MVVLASIYLTQQKLFRAIEPPLRKSAYDSAEPAGSLQ
jgi:hypothetical protein